VYFVVSVLRFRAPITISSAEIAAIKGSE
jgi:hypothetical protein